MNRQSTPTGQSLRFAFNDRQGVRPWHRSAVGVLMVCASLNGGRAVQGQTPQNQPPRQGEITANDVYVRSGPSMNHYPVAKLMAGDRVTIVGESGEWLEITPPDGVFSYISGDYVDTPDNRNGVVNGDNVRVRAGSTLEDFADLKYVVQRTLPKGAQVTILGRDPDGFLRIKPPEDVTVWVSRTYVAPPSPVRPASARDGNQEPKQPASEEVTDKAPAKPSPQSRDASAGEGGTTSKASDASLLPAESASTPVGGGSALETLPETEQRRQLIELDRLANEELHKPLAERHYKPLIEQYTSVAAQDEDEFAKQYAKARVQQLDYLANLRDTVQRLRKLGREAESKRRDYLQARASIRETLPPIPTGLDAQGELRISALYPPGEGGPRRFRLVDTSGPTPRTVGYVEIPSDSTVDVDEYLGRYVGVRAAAKRLQTGGVNPVPIYVLGELVPLQPAATDEAQQPDQPDSD